MNMKTPDKPKKSRLGKLTLKKDIFDTALKDDLKSRVDIVGLFAHFGVKLTKKGKSYTGLCPWHDDTNPSLSVDKEKGLYNCFGCGESGDVFTLVEKMKGLSFKDAMTFLQQFNTSTNGPIVSCAKQQAVSKKDDKSTNDSPKAPTVSLNDVQNYYTKKLIENKAAQEYLKKRGITNEAITYFSIGYSDDTLKKTVGKEGFEQLKDSGVFSEKGWELFASCIVVPLSDIEGRVLSFYARNIHPKSTAQHFYSAGEHKAVFHEKAYKVYDQIILAESVIDAVSLFSAGIHNVSCIFGANGLTKLHIAKLHEHGVREVVLALDNDKAGRAATEKYRDLLINEGFGVKTIFPQGKDWNDDLVSGTLDKEIIVSSINKAELYQSEETMQEQKGRQFRKTDGGLVLTHDDITYSVKQDSSSRQSIKCEVADETFYDRVDLYSARSRGSFANNVSRLFDIPARQIDKDLIALLEYLEAEKKTQQEEESEKIILTDSDKELGLSFLTNPNMFDEIVKDTETLGYVGEEINKQLMYLAATSRLLDDPISILILSESGSGKSYLVDTIKKLMPPEDVIDVTSLSDQALNYMGDLEHKFMSLSEAVHKDVIEHQLREMVSNKKLSRLVTRKNEQTGVMKTEPVSVKAIVSLVMSSTNYTVNPENASRAFVITTDESKEQTQRIYKMQREKYSFERQKLKKEAMPQIIHKHMCAQRMLHKYVIINEFNRYLDFPDSMMRFRRDQDRFIDTIAIVCHLRQYQKEVQEKDGLLTIECDLKDYEVARELLINGVLSHESDGLPTGTRRLFHSVRDIVKKKASGKGLSFHEVTIIQKEIREKTGLGHEFVKKHVRKLVEYEYLEVVSGRASGTRFAYRLREERDLHSIRIDSIPTVEEMQRRMQQPPEHTM